jgi:hypothetical protein
LGAVKRTDFTDIAAGVNAYTLVVVVGAVSAFVNRCFCSPIFHGVAVDVGLNSDRNLRVAIFDVVSLS